MPRSLEAITGLAVQIGCRTFSTAAVSTSAGGMSRRFAACTSIPRFQSAAVPSPRQMGSRAAMMPAASCPNVAKPLASRWAARFSSTGLCPASTAWRASAAFSLAAHSDTSAADPNPMLEALPAMANLYTHRLQPLLSTTSQSPAS
jgi:hypothetical protein